MVWTSHIQSDVNVMQEAQMLSTVSVLYVPREIGEENDLCSPKKTK